MSETCPKWTQEEKLNVDNMNFWIGGVLTTITGCAGLLVNAFMLRKLEPHLQANFTLKCLLMGLGIGQNLYLLSLMIDTTKNPLIADLQAHMVLWPYLLYPLKYFSLAATVFLEVGTTLERFISVRTPIKTEENDTQVSTNRKKVAKIFLPVLVMSGLLAFPRGFEFDLANSQERGDNLTISPTTLGTNQTYSEVMASIHLVILTILPILMVAYYNFKICKTIKERFDIMLPSNNRIISISSSCSSDSGSEDKEPASNKTSICLSITSNQNKRKHEDKLAKINAATTILFLLSRGLLLAPDTYQLSYMGQILHCVSKQEFAMPQKVVLVRVFGNFLTVFYCSCKLVLFYLGCIDVSETKCANRKLNICHV